LSNYKEQILHLILAKRPRKVCRALAGGGYILNKTRRVAHENEHPATRGLAVF